MGNIVINFKINGDNFAEKIVQLTKKEGKNHTEHQLNTLNQVFPNLHFGTIFHYKNGITNLKKQAQIHHHSGEKETLIDMTIGIFQLGKETCLGFKIECNGQVLSQEYIKYISLNKLNDIMNIRGSECYSKTDFQQRLENLTNLVKEQNIDLVYKGPHLKGEAFFEHKLWRFESELGSIVLYESNEEELNPDYLLNEFKLWNSLIIV